MTIFRASLCATLGAALLSATVAVNSQGQQANQSTGPRSTVGAEWPNPGGDKGATRYSPLAQITRENVRGLGIAWRRPGIADELRATVPDLQKLKPANNRAFPLVIGERIYLPNSVGLVEAIDGATGKTVWVQEPPAGQPIGGAAMRSVAYWRSGADERIFAVRNSHVWALDAKTGALATGFGDNGRVDLRPRFGAVGRAMLMWNFAPFVCNDVVIVGVGLNDNIKTRDEPPGMVQAFDVRTGKPLWTFNPIPRPGELGNETWENDSWSYSGSANVWSFMSADEELGYAYLPTGSPTSDMYGGHRLGDNLFGNSLVCVKCATGERVWHFQTIHHDLWDWDNNVAPILADIRVNGKPVKAVVQLTKQAMAFVFDRVTGAPVWPIEERPVPASTTPGERAAKTQPFPSKPAPFDRHGLTEADLIDFTPELRREAFAIARQYVLGPVFTPPSIKGDGPNATKGTLQLPGEIGGAQYMGAAFDPETGLLYVPSISATFAADLIPGDEASGLRYVRGTREHVPGPAGLPLMKPPYGRIVAIDLNRGEHVWMVANADGPRDHEAVRHLKLPPLGQPMHDRVIVTPTLLLAAQGDVVGEAATPPFGGPNGRRFRAYDKKSGAVVWELELPAGATGGMATYMAGGNQYIVLPIGTRGQAPEIVALALGGSR